VSLSLNTHWLANTKVKLHGQFYNGANLLSRLYISKHLVFGAPMRDLTAMFFTSG